MKLLNELYKGVVSENPVLRILLGICATMAVTTSLINGLGMGLTTSFVLIFSNVLISSLRGVIPLKIRLPVMIVVIATFTTIVDLWLAAYFPALSKALGIFIPLITVNCIILGRAEVVALRSPVADSLVDGLAKGFGFTLTLALIGFIREVSGKQLLIMLLPPGAFLLIGLMIGLLNLIRKWQEKAPNTSQA
jgi:Na+-translocating ferredoxin:NAD+ oxidoreductase subunit E